MKVEDQKSVEFWGLKSFGRLVENTPFPAIQRGMAIVLPLIMVGALALTVRNFPVPGVQRILDIALGPEWRGFCDNLVAGSLGIVSLAILCAVSGSMTMFLNQRRSDHFISPIMSAVVVLSCYVVLSAPADPAAWHVLSALNSGFLLSIVVAIFGCTLFLRLAQIPLLQLPTGAVGYDPVVRDILTVLPAGIVTIVVFGLLRAIFLSLHIPDVHNALSNFIFMPFSKTGDSLGFGLVYTALSQLFWFFGAHGPNVLFPVEHSILIPAGDANLALVAKGLQPSFIFTKSFFDVFTRMGGSGSTLCLIMAIAFKGRDRGTCKLCLFALLPALCNVNEPLLFGMPLVLNPIYFIPFIITPLLQTVTAYWATTSGLVPHTIPMATWTTPALFSGYSATASSAGVLMQVVNLVLGMAIYIPFVRFADLRRERQGAQILHRILDAAIGCKVGPSGHKCIDLPGNDGRLARAMANDLDKALRRGEELFVVYQPQVDGTGKRVAGVEALLRWRHPTFGLIDPPIIVALAEDSGLIDKLGLFVLSEACTQRESWKTKVPDQLTMSVNVSSQQWGNPHFVQKVVEALHAADLAPELLELEITESTMLEPAPHIIESLRRVQEHGVRIAIDDFGMGHASLRYLKSFPVNTVKIDRFLTLEPQGGVNDYIIRSVVELSRAMSITTVVEGVELQEQMDQFLSIGCEIFQGYLFSRPLSGEDCLHYISNIGN